ncbi:hypothetical protein CHS0354_020300, partial [Potamilus streckersoni]
KTFKGLNDVLCRDLKEKAFPDVQDIAKQENYIVEAHGRTKNLVSKDKSGNLVQGIDAKRAREID